MVETPEARPLLRSRTRCVWLRAPAEILAARLAADPTPRPPLMGESALDEIPDVLARRGIHYEECSRFRVPAGGSPNEIVSRVRIGLGTA